MCSEEQWSKNSPPAALNKIQPTAEEIERALSLINGKSEEDKKKKKSLNNSMRAWLDKNKDCADNSTVASSRGKERDEFLMKFFGMQARADNAAAASSKEKERKKCLVNFEEDYFASSTEKEREKCLVKFFDDYFDDQS